MHISAFRAIWANPRLAEKCGKRLVNEASKEAFQHCQANSPSGIAANMVVRRLFALLIAVAISLAPLGMPAMAEAATPAPHHGAIAKQGHCDEHANRGRGPPEAYAR